MMDSAIVEADGTLQAESGRALLLDAMVAVVRAANAEVMRVYAAQYNVMEGVQDIAAMAIRTCGGQSMLKSLPLERMYRDSRCGALMLPYTSEIMEDYIGVLALYDIEELDRAPGDEGGARNSLWRGDGGALKGLR